LGNYSYGTEEDGTTQNKDQAVWVLTPAQTTVAKADGPKLVLVLTNAPTATMQFVWQGGTTYWQDDPEILGETGNPLNGKGVIWNASAKTLTINLSQALVDYSSFTAQSSLRLIIAYYGTGGVDALGITSANLEAE
jgi:hypothetical protein